MALLYILSLILRNYFTDENIRDLPFLYSVVLLLVSLGSMYVVYNIFMLTIRMKGDKSVTSAVIGTVIMLAIVIVIYKLFALLSNEYELKRYNTVYAQQLEICNKHSIEKENALKEFRRARHDMIQHLTTLHDLVHKGEMQMLDVSISENLAFNNADMCILLGNLLDNAIEVSCRIPVDQRKISLYMKSDHNNLIIGVVNNYDGIINYGRHNKIMTSKYDSKNHGSS